MSSKITDRIERKVVLRAPRGRVFRALTDAEEFGAWFGVKMEGPFRKGTTVKGKMTDESCKGLPIEVDIDRIEPEHLFSYRWHPYAIDPEVDYSAEPKTLVVFRLEEVGPGTALTVVESGFDGIPATRREEAYREHQEGWAEQMKSIERYLAKAA
jgi:uncharacterized protein YndB with AHSA1/START domain